MISPLRPVDDSSAWAASAGWRCGGSPRPGVRTRVGRAEALGGYRAQRHRGLVAVPAGRAVRVGVAVGFGVAVRAGRTVRFVRHVRGHRTPSLGALAGDDRLTPCCRAGLPRTGHGNARPEKSALPGHSVGSPVPCGGDLQHTNQPSGRRLATQAGLKICGDLPGLIHFCPSKQWTGMAHAALSSSLPLVRRTARVSYLTGRQVPACRTERRNSPRCCSPRCCSPRGGARRRGRFASALRFAGAPSHALAGRPG